MLRTAPRGEASDPDFDTAPYQAIGESDRMTLRFVKPAPEAGEASDGGESGESEALDEDGAGGGDDTP